VILLDTNVLSEFMRPVPGESVVSWLDKQEANQVWISAITRAEIELGLALLPDGQRKSALVAAANAIFSEDFSGRCVPFDEAAARCYAQCVTERSRMGRPISVEDAQIASIALSRGLVLATRNERDFEMIEGLSIVNPWHVDS
jgi:hypothetical protein